MRGDDNRLNALTPRQPGKERFRVLQRVIARLIQIADDMLLRHGGPGPGIVRTKAGQEPIDTADAPQDLPHVREDPLGNVTRWEAVAGQLLVKAPELRSTNYALGRAKFQARRRL
jgi:hypothetical protein